MPKTPDQEKPNRRGAHFTREFQRWARSHVSSESCAENGAKGFQVAAERHGRDFAVEAARQWRVDNPSFPEQVMGGLLKHMKVEFEREWQVPGSNLSADFHLKKTNQVIEVHSSLHNYKRVAQRDERKQELLAAQGIPCLVVWDHELTDTNKSPATVERVREFIQSGRERERERAIEGHGRQIDGPGLSRGRR